MNGKYPLTCIAVLDSDTQKWYEAEQCWNREPEELRKLQTQKTRQQENGLRNSINLTKKRRGLSPLFPCFNGEKPSYFTKI